MVSESENDFFLFYYTGNGSELRSQKSADRMMVATILPYDFTWEKNGTFTIYELLDAIEKIPAKHKLLMIDACHSTSGVPESTTPLITDNNPSDSVIEVLGASGGTQTSAEGPNGGAFSQAVIKVLTDSAANGEYGLWVPDLYSRVKLIVEQGGYTQTTTLIRVSGNGEISLKPKIAPVPE